TVFAAASFRWHTVTRGETLAGIARKFKITTAKLAAANDLKPTSRLKGGTMLMVLVSPAFALVAARLTGVAAVASASSSSGERATYKVKPGDTLSTIARQFDMSVKEIKKLNELFMDVIVPGDKLTVRR